METEANIYSKLRRDGGWTLVEALISVVLISILFLGFTVSVLAFKEWTTRSWALRVMDQYANDVVSSINERLETAFSYSVLPPQNGLSRFKLLLLDINLYNVQLIDSSNVIFSAHPQDGVMIAEQNTAPKNIDSSTPFEEWWGTHNFSITEFSFTPGNEISEYGSQSENFQKAIMKIRMRFEYERIPVGESSGGGGNDSYTIYKEYNVSAFLKNYQHRPSTDI